MFSDNPMNGGYFAPFDPNAFAGGSGGSLGVSYLINNQSNGMATFKVGDRVKVKGLTNDIGVIRIINDSDSIGVSFPKWNRGHHLDGTFKDVINNGYWVDKSVLTLVPPTPSKPKSFDLKKLDALIVEEDVRLEIESVLKQHKNANIIFEEWGVGETIEYGRGMTFLFYGPPGTGKTWAANCISKVFGKEILTIGAAEIQTSEPGGANRNIQQAFKTAKEEDKILFLDECDSLITSRNDVGMVLGGEINTLLTEIEKSEGVVILATNRVENLDEALERRISLIVEFPHPNLEQRKAIWGRLIPKKMPLEKDVTLDELAGFELTGGQIKNAVLQGARLALASDGKRVGMLHFKAAIERIVKSKNLLGTASRYHQGIVEDFSK